MYISLDWFPCLQFIGYSWKKPTSLSSAFRKLPLFVGTYLVRVSKRQHPTALYQAESVIKNAIEQTDDSFKIALNMRNGDNVDIIHRAFQVRPASSEDRFWNSCVAEPVSPWAFSNMLNVLHKRSKDEAYRFYYTIKGHPEASYSVERFLKIIFTHI